MSDPSTPRADVPPALSPPVTDYRSTPAGVLPRQLPRWLLLGIAVVMVGIMALSGRVPTPRSASTSAATSVPAVDANQQRIEEYQHRIQEQTQRLAAEQAALQAVKDAPEMRALAPALAAPLNPPAAGEPARVTQAGSGAATRGDRSLFADSVAFTREPRRTAVPAADGAGPVPAASLPTMPLLPVASVVPPVAPSPLTTPSGTPLTVSQAAGDSAAGAVALSRTPASPDPRRYRIPEGSIIETVLTNRLDGTYTGPVNCLVTTAVYASDRQHVLIPAGARVLGEARPVTAFGQVRLAVVFHRVLLPDGSRVALDAFHGLDQIGATGLRDQVDRHYAQVFGASLAVGAIAGLAQAQTSIGLDSTALDAYRQGAAANLAQSSARILDRFLNLLPTVTIREGHRIKVYLSNDLDLPAYRDDRTSPNPSEPGDRP